MTGFIKPFEDVMNKGVLLYARAVNNGATGVVVKPQIFEEGDSKGDIMSKIGMEINTPAIAVNAGNEDGFYQLLVGDTRYGSVPCQCVF